MADKRYYWLKLQRDFFKRNDILVIESMPNGKDYILFYLKLLCESIEHGGDLRFNDQIPYNEEMLSTITGTNVDIVRSAIKVFNELGMIDILDDGTLYMNDVQKLIGSAENEAHAERQRRYRERQKQAALADGVKTQPSQERHATVTECHTVTHKELDIEVDKDKDKKTAKRFIPPTLEDVRGYCNERNNGVDAQRFVDYYTSNGWKVGKNKMQDWKAAVRTWERSTQKQTEKDTSLSDIFI